MQNNNSKVANILLVAILILLAYFGVKYLKNSNDTVVEKDAMIDEINDDVEEEESIMNRTLLEGRSDDLIAFSVWPGTSVHGVVSYRGTIQGAYFFEANILVGVADVNKNIILQSNAMATTDWMTAGPVDFEGYLDFTGLPVGPAYVVLHNDNASGLPENDKAIYIPVIIQ